MSRRAGPHEHDTAPSASRARVFAPRRNSAHSLPVEPDPRQARVPGLGHRPSFRMAFSPATLGVPDTGTGLHLTDINRKYSPVDRKWRDSLVAKVVRDGLWPDGRPARQSREQVARIVDEVAARVMVVTHALHALHGIPDLGNVRDPVAELIYIVLCWRTRIRTAKKVLRTLYAAFGRWEDLGDPSRRQKLLSVLKRGGFAAKKALALQGIVSRLVADFGAVDLSVLKQWPDDQVLTYLTSLPGVDLKGAQCVMLYAFGRKVLPVDAHTIRVLGRLGVLDPITGDLKGLEHRVVQQRLRTAVAPSLRGALHVTLVEHGRKTCGQTPLCERCELRKFCGYWRAKERSAKVKVTNGPTLVDLFAGAGGISSGFDRHGYRVVLAVDSDAAACRTYRFNHPAVPETQVVCGKIESLVRRRGGLALLAGARKVDVLSAGLPCQGFSKVGYRTKPHLEERPTLTTDPRNHLFRPLLMAVRQLRPRAVVVENVPDMGLASTNGTPVSTRLERGLKREGYSVQAFVLNAAELGVPQVRNRLFVVAAKGLGTLPDIKQWLSEHHGLRRPRSLSTALRGLNRLGAGEGGPLQRIKVQGATRLLFNHQARPHNERDLQLFSMLAPGDNARDALAKAGPELMRYSTTSFRDKYFMLRPDRPCRTIVAHLQKDANSFIHPFDHRGLTAREAARVQGFPDDYIFLGTRSDHFAQIGNAVPPPLAEYLAGFLRRLLQRARR
jgi:DNA (cytosine-5)-methyltransferase 1